MYPHHVLKHVEIFLKQHAILWFQVDKRCSYHGVRIDEACGCRCEMPYFGKLCEREYQGRLTTIILGAYKNKISFLYFFRNVKMWKKCCLLCHVSKSWWFGARERLRSIMFCTPYSHMSDFQQTSPTPTPPQPAKMDLLHIYTIHSWLLTGLVGSFL